MISDSELLSAFESGRIDNTDFPHERHVRVAWGLARRYHHDEALSRLTAGIRGIAERAGKPGAYHETITRAWFELIASAETLGQYAELFDKGLLDRYYSPERLAAGRGEWLEPDLHPLRLPAPEPSPPLADLPAVLRGIPTTVAILGARTEQGVHATTVSSLTSVSREPALISVCVANGSRALAFLHNAQAFALSVLAADQDELASHFAHPARPSGAAQFATVPHHLSPYGPVIDTAASWIGCHVHAIHRTGDHHIVFGQVGYAKATERRSLVRHDGVYAEHIVKPPTS
jgi:flavin reductase (DIM6/NTAB) family NADH-FMN oxidoreductase RutF